MITPRERSSVRTMLQSAGWKSVEQIIKELTDKFNAESVVRESEWETIKAALIKEGMIRGMNNLVKELMEQALNQDEK